MAYHPARPEYGSALAWPLFGKKNKLEMASKQTRNGLEMALFVRKKKMLMALFVREIK